MVDRVRAKVWTLSLGRTSKSVKLRHTRRMARELTLHCVFPVSGSFRFADQLVADSRQPTRRIHIQAGSPNPHFFIPPTPTRDPREKRSVAVVGLRRSVRQNQEDKLTDENRKTKAKHQVAYPQSVSTSSVPAEMTFFT